MNSRAMPASLVLDDYTADESGPKNAPEPTNLLPVTDASVAPRNRP